MAVIGNTYVGGNPVDEQLSASFRSAGANLAQGLQQRRAMGQDRSTAAFTELDGQVKAIYDEYGPQAFQPHVEADPSDPGAYLTKNKDGKEIWVIDNPYYEQTKQALVGAGIAFQKATGGNAADYMAGMFNSPVSRDKQIQWDERMGIMRQTLAEEKRGESSGESGVPGVLVSQKEEVPQGGGGGGQTPAPAPMQETPPLPPPASGRVPATQWEQRQFDKAPVTSLGHFGEYARAYGAEPPTAVPGGQADFRAQHAAGTLQPAVQDGTPWISGTLDPSSRSGMSSSEVSQFTPSKTPTPQELAQFKDELMRGDTATRNRLLKENPQLASMLSKPASNPASSVLNRTSGFLSNNARGSGKPAMTQAELREHERKTGDIHFPALIGVKEGVVNARAMDAGGREIVRQLNNSFPIFAGGFWGENPEAPPVDPMTANIAQQGSRATAPSTGAGQAALQASQEPVAEVPDPSVENPQSAPQLPPGMTHQDKKPDMVADVIAATPSEKPLPEPKSSPKLVDLKQKFDQFLMEGKDKKAAAVQQARIAEEGRIMKGYTFNPAVASHNKRVSENMYKFIHEASDTDLAYYGFDKVLAQKQKAREFEEEKGKNATNKAYMESMTKASDKSTDVALLQAKIEQAKLDKLMAEEALIKARTKALLNGGGGVDLEYTVDLIKTSLDMAGGDSEKFNALLATQPGLKKAMDNWSMHVSGVPWNPLVKSTNWFSQLKGLFGEEVPYVAQPAGQSGGAGQSAGQGGVKVDDPAALDELRRSLNL